MPHTDIQRQLIGLFFVDSDNIVIAERTISPHYFTVPFVVDIVGLIFDSHRNGSHVDPVTIKAAFEGGDEKVFNTRCTHACAYFFPSLKKNEYPSKDEVLNRVSSFLVECYASAPTGAFLQSMLDEIRHDYVVCERDRITQQFLSNINRNPQDISVLEDYCTRLQELSTLEKGASWTEARLNLESLSKTKFQGPIILRGEDGLIYRGDVHMISGAPGTMKSKFVWMIAAAALNDGLQADVTLGMYAGTSGLRVAYIDTELGEDEIHRRIPLLETACGRVMFDPTRFVYLTIRKYNKSERRRLTYDTIRSGQFDVIIVDGLRDICTDFNDSLEAATLADTFKRLADTMKVAIIVTSHTTKGTDYSRGHLGSQFYDEVGLELLLKGDPNDRTQVSVLFRKTRSSLPKEFSFTHRLNSLTEVDSLIDQSELRRSQKTAVDKFMLYLTPGKEYSYTQILNTLVQNQINESTAKKYIREAKGVTLRYDDQNNTYVLPPKETEKGIFESDDLPY